MLWIHIIPALTTFKNTTKLIFKLSIEKDLQKNTADNDEKCIFCPEFGEVPELNPFSPASPLTFPSPPGHYPCQIIQQCINNGNQQQCKDA